MSNRRKNISNQNRPSGKSFENNYREASKLYGPGVWYSIHILGQIYNKKTMQGILEELFKNFPCGTCSKHAMDYIRKYPISEAKDVRDSYWGDITVSNYLCNLHNKVNRRINEKTETQQKAIIDIETYLIVYRLKEITPYQLYTGGLDCPGCSNKS